ncbi:MAG: TrkH family potassium uptake protein [Treponema sp.]|jgi:trk system potassium uptake protein TrkH|nr:TrkH family potassium uptake protein [Treponema sp.]
MAKNRRHLKWLTLLRLLVLLLGITALTMAPALILALVLEEKAMVRAFVPVMGTALAAALPVFFTFRRESLNLSHRDGFLLVFLAWVFASLMGAFPYYLSGGSGGTAINMTDAVFESVCGFATTGATTLADVESLPRSLVLWRSMSHWFGGMGIVLLMVALMPLLGVGGFQLIKAETPGPEKEKVTPKITSTAKILWFVYCILTAALTVLFLLGGMPFFDALCHAFTTMASGGVSTKNAGLAYYNSAFIDGTAAVFMLLAGFNFNLYYRLLRGKIKDVLINTEGRAYLFIFITAAGIITFALTPVYGSAGTALRYAAYHAASILSTTGSAIVDYETWPVTAKGVLFCLMFIGGCSGSTAGGVKVIRHVVLWKQAGNELRRSIFPRGVFGVQLNRKVGRRDVIYGAAGFTALYGLVTAALTLIAAASGTDVFSSFSAALSVTGNAGVGFGAIGPSKNYAAFADHLKWIYSFVMIAGRLELWTVFILFTPEFWRR